MDSGDNIAFSDVRGGAAHAPRKDHSLTEPTPTIEVVNPEAARAATRLWWVWLGFGLVWVTVAMVILQFDQASVKTVGVLVGLMFLATSAQQLVLAMLVDTGKWLFVAFGMLFAMSGIIALSSPEDTFTALADIMGFLFLIVGVYWVIQAFASRDVNPLWGVGLVAGILMLILAFWTSGQFYIEKQYMLLVFTGIWALLQGVNDIVRAFQIRKLGQLI